ncbi:hypothetical protein K490DRAFT_51840 [Saccharata proteae CBS 121410]|uniref:Protein-tyrosine-phosphatase n=1 Tax=Saccharata proteae CBS 121410 TaxID=1314787 RepID=A0A9P4HKR4_9PEZI|nr:hypothetical protein K490DRAFT_51840 [Saccharata proteae CBS 121410]
MAAAVARAPSMPPPSSSTPPPHLSLNTSARGTPAPVPNKHLPFCSPGPQPTLRALDTPPASPPCQNAAIETSTLLSPPDAFPTLSTTPPIYSIDAHTLAHALDHIATQPLPEPKDVFPWLHGLHPENQIQLAFFVQRKTSLRKVPRCIRGITIVKAGGDLTHAKLKGAIPPNELLPTHKTAGDTASFLEIDPRDGFSVRNFQIQACKMATVSDIVVYGDERTSRKEVLRLAERVARAQEAWRKRQVAAGSEVHTFGTFVVTVADKFTKFEEQHPELVAVDSNGSMTGNVMDFFYRERLEMCTMSAASEISPNVFLGPSPDPELGIPAANADSFDLLIETCDQAQLPDKRTFAHLNKQLRKPGRGQVTMQFPSSGSIMPPTWSHAEIDSLLETCRWMYHLANPGKDDEEDMNSQSSVDKDGDSVMSTTSTTIQTPKKILIHCADGYTESSLLGLTYYIFATGLPVHEAWISLHRDRHRNFFTYPSDVSLLTAIQPRLLQESPVFCRRDTVSSTPQWFTALDGSLPSRILPNMYLGNLSHANNPSLLRSLGITRILSVGEPVSWNPSALSPPWPARDLMKVDGVQDNGVDPLTAEFGRCLGFIEEGGREGGRTLVHCRVGVSRSATICIAEVMRREGWAFGTAYCFVRARRLNVIIQPHLRFTYELLKWEERQRVRRGLPLRRELEWGTVAREIAAMNRPYSRT